MAEAKVLIVDDSSLLRRMIAEVVRRERGLTVSGQCENGQVAIDALDAERADVVLLDLEMPVLDGLGALRIIKDRWPELPVIVFSSTTEAGSAATAEALTLGAAECVLKPSGANPTETREAIAVALLPVVRALVDKAGHAPAAAVPVKRHGPDAVELVVVASSTGGPRALKKFLPGLHRLDVPVLIVQHLPAEFSDSMAAQLSTGTGQTVEVAVDGAALQPGQVCMAPGDRHLEVARFGRGLAMRLTDGPKVNHLRPAADLLFTSAARATDGRLLAVVLTGMGADGAAGAADIVDAGGLVLAQDEATSVVWGMPGSVVKAGLASEIAEPARLAGSVRRLIRGRSRQPAR